MIDVARKEKEKGRRVAVAFRLLPSMKVVHSCIDYANASADEKLSYAEVLPFKKTQVGSLEDLNNSQKPGTSSPKSHSNPTSSSSTWRAFPSSRFTKCITPSSCSTLIWERKKRGRR